MFASHHWPRWGNDRVLKVMRAQRDLYANLNNQCLHLANRGITINQTIRFTTTTRCPKDSSSNGTRAAITGHNNTTPAESSNATLVFGIAIQQL